MMEILSTFAALSMAGTVILSLLPEGSIKRTAAMVTGLLTLMCWAEGIAGLMDIELSASMPESVLAPTSVSVDESARDAALALEAMWEDTP